MHTFGVGHGASEELIKQAACKGFGHFSFIYNEKEIEEIVVKALSRTQLDYLILHKAVLFDESGEKIQGALDMQAQPIRDGSFVDLTSLLPPGV